VTILTTSPLIQPSITESVSQLALLCRCCCYNSIVDYAQSPLNSNFRRILSYYYYVPNCKVNTYISSEIPTSLTSLYNVIKIERIFTQRFSSTRFRSVAFHLLKYFSIFISCTARPDKSWQTTTVYMLYFYIS